MKLAFARSQLGTALDLFIRDRDPISVHALACGGSELIEGIAESASLPTLSTHILGTFPGIEMKRIKALRNQYWNAMKHFYLMDGKNPRDDAGLMANFSDAANDTVLFMGWLDYLQLTKRLPVEVQVFQVWYYATNEERLDAGADWKPHRAFFPGIREVPRGEQKRRLRRAVEKYRRNPAILADPRTEVAPLVSGRG